MAKETEVKYKVKVVSDTSGVEKVKNAITELNDTAKAAQSKVESMGKAFQNLGWFATAGIGLNKAFGTCNIGTASGKCLYSTVRKRSVKSGNNYIVVF